MGKREYVDRLANDYRKTFKTASGKHVLMDLYSRCYGLATTFPTSGNPFEMAKNEGMRMVLLHVLAHLKENDQDMRKLWEQHVAEREREEIG